MNEDKRKPVMRDRTRIDKNEPYELEFWARKFNITPEKLRETIEKSGLSEVKAIEKYLITHYE